jgi:ABC-type antimicrobial peptide transport system permease subunit
MMARLPKGVLRGIVVIIGMACVTFGLAITIAARNGVEYEFDMLIDSIGSNLFRVMGREGRTIENTVTAVPVPFSQADVDRLCASDGIISVAAATNGLTSYGRARYVGVTPSYFRAHQMQMHSGRAFEEDEIGVCVLSHEYAEATYNGDSPIGSVLDTGSTQHRVIGVLEPMPLEMGSQWLWTDARIADVLFPVSDYCTLFDSLIGVGDCSAAPFGNLWVRVDPAKPRQGLESILSVLGEASQLDSISTLYGFTFGLRRHIVSLYSLVALALLFVGGVSTFAMSLTTVASESQAIGTRRALGAPRGAPGGRVLLRLIAYTLGGIVIGSACVAWLAPVFSRLLSITLRFGLMHLAGGALLLAVALLAGLLPALRASRVPPLRAIRSLPLRYESSPLRGLGWLVTVASVVGIASVVFVAALSDSLESALRDLYGDMRPNVVAVTGGMLPGTNSQPFDLSEQDVEAIQALLSVNAVSGELSVVMSEALYADEPIMGRLYRMRSFGERFFVGRLIDGRLPTDQELETGRPVALVGTLVAERGMDAKDPIGGELVIGERAFHIIGVFDSPKVSIQASAPGWKILVPANSLDDSNDGRYLAWVKMNPIYDVEETIIEIRQLLADLYPDAAPARIEGPAVEMGKMIAVTNGITYGLFRLGFLTLLVSAFALGSLFWSQTVRRQRQISLERALGASAWHVFWTTFKMAFGTTCIAGVLATGIGIAGTLLVQDWFSFWSSFQFNPIWTLWAVGATLIAATVGGGLPALWAARLSPMEGIRKGRF